MKAPVNFLTPPGVLLALSLGVAGCGGGDRDSRLAFGPAELAIERPSLPEPVAHEDGTVTRVFPLTREALRQLVASANQAAGRTDGRAPLQPTVDNLRDLPLETLKRLGVGFPEGTGAVYDLESATLTVRQSLEWIDYLAPLLESYDPGEINLSLRIEIYEIPAALALRLEQSASEYREHTAEWRAVRKLLEGGEARFVTSCHLQTRSGVRGVVTDGETYSVVAGFKNRTAGNKEEGEGDGADAGAPVPFLEEVAVGTIAEFDAVAEPLTGIIDLMLNLKHHTAPPEFIAVEVPVPGRSEPVEIEVPAFHVKTLMTTLTVKSGDTRLLGSWRPTGKPEFEKKKVMRTVFFRADVQKAGGRGG